MDVVDFLQKHVFTRDREYVVVVVPERVLMAALPGFMAQLLEGGIMAARFEMVNNPPADYAVNVPKDL